MSMVLFIEARVALPGHRIMEFAMKLPSQMKLNGSHTRCGNTAIFVKFFNQRGLHGKYEN
jgi:hypothetical protein